MLYIDDQLPHVQHAKTLHIKLMTCYVKRKIYGSASASRCGDPKCRICSSGIRKHNASAFLLSLLNMIDIEELLGGSPKTLTTINKLFTRLYKEFLPEIQDEDKKSLNSIFNYDWFNNKEANSQYNAYDLCSNLKIETCVYCNRLYTSTVITERRERVIRPTLDHWFPQAKYPLLALSFYNLIPSCSPCNSSVKHSNPFELRNNIHPYVDKNMTNEYKLKTTYDQSLNTFKIGVETQNTKIAFTLEAMKIAAIYEHHQSELADLNLLQRKYNKSYLKNLGKLLGTKLTDKDVYRIVFGVEYDDENFYKRPLSKLKKDILGLTIT
jgi:hypothetical protein